MRAINHTVTGAVIGAAVSNPWLALPAALMSHVVLDAIPHAGGEKGGHTSTFFKVSLLIDAALSAGFLLAVMLLQPHNWLQIIACGALGAAPDLHWATYWYWELKGAPKKLDPFGRFLSWIQWSETKAGYIVEAFWLAGSLYVFLLVSS